MADQTFDYARAYGSALVIGPLPLSLVWGVGSLVMVSIEGSLELAPLALMMGIPVWIVGVLFWAVGLLIFMPVWWALRRAGCGERRHAIALGSVSVATIWYLAFALDGVDIGDVVWTVVGGLSGAAAGLVGWRAGTFPEPKL